MTIRGWRARSSSGARSPRWDEPLSTIQNTRRAERYGSWLITSSTSRPKAALPVFRLAAAKDHGAMDVPGSHVLQDPSALVLVFDAHRLLRSNGQAGVA